MNEDIIAKYIILCEGITDAILISYYLGEVSNWEYVKAKNAPFEKFSDNINWYKTQNDYYCAIWSVGSHDFAKAIYSIIEKEKLEHSIENIIIVTDHDDEEAETKRFSDIQDIFLVNQFSLSNSLSTSFDVTIVDSFQNRNVISIQYLLVPNNKIGALETFMLDALTEQDNDKKKVIEQVDNFVNNFDSNKYLTKRREKIKAKLGISLSIFSPDKIFTTMNELLKSVHWSKFETTNKQFQILKDLK